MQPAFLHLQKVSYSYPGGQPVLHDLDLEINRNDLLVIRGESGAGKSTFLKLFNRFCDVHKGEIYFNGKALSEYDIDRLRSKVIYLPQLPLMINGTIRDNLYFPFTFHSHMHKEFNPEKAEKWLDYFQVDAALDHDALKLSIGQRQRIALIRALLPEPEVLLLDEPGSALDPNNKKLIEQKIESLVTDGNITVIMATHSAVSFSGPCCRFFNLEEKNLKELS